MKTENKNTIGERMKELRGQMSQRQAAICVGIKPQNWNVYENGQSLPGAQVIINICKYFHVSADWFLGCEESRNTTHESFARHAPVPLPSSPETVMAAEIAALKLRVKALEDAAGSPSFACG